MKPPKTKDRIPMPKGSKKRAEYLVSKLPRYRGLYSGVKKAIKHYEKYHKGEKVL